MVGLFNAYNAKYFGGRLGTVVVGWSKRMTLCAGLCKYEGRGGLCEIRMSEPLLKYRSRGDMVSTLLHEMIHAYLFVTESNTDRDGHGPRFLAEAEHLNRAEGCNITVFHSFNDEVNLYRTHWWQCQGPCRRIVKRAMNRAPAPHDVWWPMHVRSCGGYFLKTREPQPANKRSAKRPPAGPPAQPQPKTPRSKAFPGVGRQAGSSRDASSPQKSSSGSSIWSNKTESSSSRLSKDSSEKPNYAIFNGGRNDVSQ
ncbi:MAG: SprT family zinc-dependent metalloprotease [archaeon]|nr:SprT family zinc-dependent metalloprotease [archaeon]